MMSDAERVLLLFAGRYYTVDEMLRVAGGRDVMFQSSVWQAAEGRAKGLAEARELRAELVRELHVRIADRALPVVASCSASVALKRWALLAAKASDADLLKNLGLG